MSTVRVNDKAAFEATICLPRLGAWHADVHVDSVTEVKGKVTIAIGDGQLQLFGTVARGGTFVDSAHVRVVAGAGGMATMARPRHYNSTNVGIVLRDLLREAGEAVSSTASAALLSKPLLSWSTMRMETGKLVTNLMASASPGTAWRFLDDGTVWAGPETWPDSGIRDPDVQVIDETPHLANALLGVEVPTLQPGTLLLGRRVSYVEHRIGAGGVRTTAWFEDE